MFLLVLLMVIRNLISPEVRVYTKPPRKKRDGGSGFKSKGRYWSKVPNALRRINTQRHLQFLERKGLSHCGKENCKYCPPLADLESKAPCSVSPAPTNSGPSDQGFSKRTYRFNGYLGEEKYIEVRPNPISKEPRFKNKIAEMIWRSKNN